MPQIVALPDGREVEFPDGLDYGTMDREIRKFLSIPSQEISAPARAPELPGGVEWSQDLPEQEMGSAPAAPVEVEEEGSPSLGAMGALAGRFPFAMPPASKQPTMYVPHYTKGDIDESMFSPSPTAEHRVGPAGRPYVQEPDESMQTLPTVGVPERPTQAFPAAEQGPEATMAVVKAHREWYERMNVGRGDQLSTGAIAQDFLDGLERMNEEPVEESVAQPWGKEGTFTRGISEVIVAMERDPALLVAAFNPATAAAVAVRYGPQIVHDLMKDIGLAVEGDDQAAGRAVAQLVPILTGAGVSSYRGLKRVRAGISRAEYLGQAKNMEPWQTDALARLGLTVERAERVVPLLAAEAAKGPGPVGYRWEGPMSEPPKRPVRETKPPPPAPEAPPAEPTPPPGETGALGPQVTPGQPEFAPKEGEPLPPSPGYKIATEFVLRDLGYTPDEILGISPAEIREIIARKIPGPEGVAIRGTPLEINRPIAQALDELGYTLTQIKKMDPREAMEIVANQVPAKPAAAPAGAAAPEPGLTKSAPPATKTEPATTKSAPPATTAVPLETTASAEKTTASAEKTTASAEKTTASARYESIGQMLKDWDDRAYFEQVLHEWDPTVNLSPGGTYLQRTVDGKTTKVSSKEFLEWFNSRGRKTTPTEGGPSAGSYQETTEVHGDVLRDAQEGEGAAKVPVEESQPGVREEAVAGAVPPKIEGMGGAVPSEFDPIHPGRLTSTKHAHIDRERIVHNLPPREETTRRSWEAAKAEALRRMDEDPAYQDKLIDRLRDDPQPVDDIDNVVLTERAVSVQNEFDRTLDLIARAIEDKRLEDAQSLVAHRERIRSQLSDLYEILDATGTADGRGLNARKMIADAAFNLVRMEDELINTLKRPLDESEKAALAKIDADIRSANKKLEQLNIQKDIMLSEAKGEAALQKLIAETMREELKKEKAKPPTIPQHIQRIVDKVASTLETRANAARARIRGKLFTITDPRLLKDLAEIGADNIMKVGEEVAAWSAKMISDIGEHVKPHLEQLYQESLKMYEAVTDEAQGGKATKAVKQGVKTAVAARTKRPDPTPQEMIDQMSERISESVGEGDLEIQPYIDRMAREFVKQGITKPDFLVDAIHGQIRDLMPEGWTIQQTRDLVSKYGQLKQLSKDPVSVKLREIRGELRAHAKIEDLTARPPRRPKRSGVEMPVPAEQERRLNKQINELKKRVQFPDEDVPGRVRTALQAAHTRVGNQIKDLEVEIAERRLIVRDKVALEYDQKLKDLIKRRDELKAEKEAIFGKKELTDQQRIEIAMRAIEKSTADLERRLAANDLSSRARLSRTPKTPELEAARAKRDALQAQLDELRTLAKPKKELWEIDLAALKTRLRRQEEQLLEKAAKGDFEKKTPREIRWDDEARALEFKRDEAKRAYIEKKLVAQFMASGNFSKTMQGVLLATNAARSIMTSMDVSAVGRQGGWFWAMHPKVAAKNIVTMFRGMTKEGQHRVEADMREHPKVKSGRAKRAGLDLSDSRPLTWAKAEEGYQSRLADRIPLVSHTGRAYQVYLNRMRLDVFDVMTEIVESWGETSLANDKLIANMVNIVSGRGTLPGGEKVLAAGSAFLFAPRFVVSRVQAATLYPLWYASKQHKIPLFSKETRAARGLIAMEYAKVLTAYAALFTLAYVAGAEINLTDPTHSDWAKLRFGNTRIDPMIGISQIVVMVARSLSGQKTAMSGEVQDLRGPGRPYGGATVISNLGQFLRRKLAPLPAATMDALQQEDVNGQEVTPLGILGKLVTPMTFDDIRKVMNEWGVPEGIALMMLQLLGVSIQVYDQEGRVREPRF